MSTKFKVNAYDVTQCGYYKNKSTPAAFGVLQELLDDLALWANGKDLKDTSTFQPHSESDQVPVYCFDIKRSATGNLWLLTTWNAAPLIGGKVQSVKGTSKVGSAAVSGTTTGPDEIPGFPAMFLFHPAKGAFFTVLPVGRTQNGQRGMNRFMHGFLKSHSGFVVTDTQGDEDSPDIKILGYKKKGTSDKPGRYRPRFFSKMKLLSGQIDFLRSNRTRIKKVVRRDLLHVGVHAERGLIQRLLRNLGLTNVSSAVHNYTVSYELDMHPSATEFEEIVEAALSDDQLDDEKVGFQLTGDTTTHWLSVARAKGEFELPIDPDHNEIFSAEDLLTEFAKLLGQLESLAGLT